jgi:hypothetical protein
MGKVGRTLDAGDDEGGEGGIDDDDERGEKPEILSVEEKTLRFPEPPPPSPSRTELHYEYEYEYEGGLGLGLEVRLGWVA